MGSNAIISVLGFIIVFSIVNSSINKGNIRSYDNTYGYLKYRTARDISRSSIQITLRKIDTLSTVTSSAFPVTGSLNSGTYTVNGVILNDSMIQLTALGTFSDSVYRIKTTLLRHHIPFDSSVFNGALGIHPSTLASFSMQGGKDTVDGRDHDWNGKLIPANPAVAGVQATTTSDSTTVYNGAGSDVVNILGTPKIRVTNGIPDPDTSAFNYKGIADYVYTNGKAGKDSSITGGSWGDSTHPVIVYCEGYDVGGFKFTGNAEGWGILVVRGGLTFAGNTTWHGLIIDFSKTTPITFAVASGGIQLYGGVLFGGLPGGSYGLKGNSKILYSRQALMMAKNIEQPFVYNIIDWYE